ncbi:MAG TPA: FAD-binding oxidoreductase [Alphaproteobacteria bacterium]|nr:FAD-binding oxidoreductase [Alphaproteobacteria bacterium]
MSPPVDAVRSDEKLPASADVVIIGGGIIGCAAAYALAKKGLSVVVLEKGRVGGEQSSRNWGWCRQQMRDTREIPLIKESLALWGGLNEEIGADTGFRRTGLIYVTKDAAELARWEAWLEHARPYQLHSRLLSAAEAQAMMPGCEEKWLGGLYTPSDGRAEPAKAAPAIAMAARRLGVTLHQGCAARGIETEAGAVASVVSELGVVRARAVLCAGGAWTSLFCRRHGIDLPQLSVRASVLRTAPAPEVLAAPVSSPGFGMRRRLDGGYTVGMRGAASLDLTPDAFRYLRAFWPAYRQGVVALNIKFGRPFFTALATPHHWAFDQASPFEKMRVLDPAPEQSVLEAALANLKAAYPALRDVKVAETWAGMIEGTPDAIPVISPVESLKGFYIATGFSGHGFGIAPAAGRLAADIIAGETPIVDPRPFRYARMIDGTRLAPQTGL